MESQTENNEIAAAIVEAGETIANATDTPDMTGVAEEIKGVVVELHHGIGETGSAIRRTLESPSECDNNGESANVVDGLFSIARSIDGLAGAIRERPPEFDWEKGQVE